MSARQVRRFQLERDVDVSGVSGTGAVAFGAQAPDGTCVLWWDSEHDSIGIYPTMETLLAIHGHGGSTRVVYIDAADQTVPAVAVGPAASAVPVLSAASPVPGPASPVPGPASPVPGPASPVPGPASPVPGPASPVPSPGSLATPARSARPNAPLRAAPSLRLGSAARSAAAARGPRPSPTRKTQPGGDGR
ncbi:hypothetical protein CcI6DRAFT_04280 [Frankia sp. CcI6]|uniref:hypothetical protein n=1 Tax=Frankia TaxID=1854 RepID=UPI0003D04190|nr:MULTISPECIES: hypothetical protein [Frankia]ETA00276.1 hypothetical protein CcI6DRAFT_04280 [Frankia sp. CcI6]OAA18746.1 hypothetical protein AAY23_111720 [Frankia casuarinae]